MKFRTEATDNMLREMLKEDKGNLEKWDERRTKVRGGKEREKKRSRSYHIWRIENGINAYAQK